MEAKYQKCVIENTSVSYHHTDLRMPQQEPKHPWAVSVVFGVAAAVAAVSFVPLWETKDTCLPDTVAQLEEMDVHRKAKPRSSK